MTTTTNQTCPIKYIRALHRNTDGYVTLFKKQPHNKVMQRHYKLEQLNDNTIRQFVDFDCYVSLNSFYRMQRGNAHLRTLHNLYVDLDCYNVDMSVEQVMYELEQDYFNQSIPMPNLVVYSGRGVQLVWHIEAISGLAIERWGIVQRAICKTLSRFGADTQALDASRVFRLPASINSKNNEIVRYDMLHDHEYNLSELGKEYFGILPKPTREPKQRTKPKRSVTFGFTFHTLAQARLQDIETLITMRKGACKGARERMLFLARYFALTVTKNKQAAIQKIEFLNGLFDVPLSQSELVNATRSAETYFEGNGFTISNARMIEWLGITAAEQTKLSTIISKAEKRERNRVSKQKARRAQGTKTRAQYDRKRLRAVVRNVKRVKLALAICPTLSIRALAAKLGLSKSYVAELMGALDAYAALEEKVSVGVSASIKRVAIAFDCLGLCSTLVNGLYGLVGESDRGNRGKDRLDAYSPT